MHILDGSAVFTDASGNSITALIAENHAKEFTPSSPEWGALVSGGYGVVAPFDAAGNAAQNVRKMRNEKLAETDWRFRVDMTPSQEWIDYCQALRDIPQQAGFPESVVWPIKP